MPQAAEKVQNVAEFKMHLDFRVKLNELIQGSLQWNLATDRCAGTDTAAAEWGKVDMKAEWQKVQIFSLLQSTADVTQEEEQMKRSVNMSVLLCYCSGVSWALAHGDWYVHCPRT